MGSPMRASSCVITTPGEQPPVWQRVSMPLPSGLCRNASSPDFPPWQMAVVVQNQPLSKLTRYGMRLAIRIALGPTYCSVMSIPPSPACVRDSSMPFVASLLKLLPLPLTL